MPQLDQIFYLAACSTPCNYDSYLLNYEEVYVPLSLALHLLAATIWVGGMFFAYQILRPVDGEMLEPPIR